jgi:hypothetical protein
MAGAFSVGSHTDYNLLTQSAIEQALAELRVN